MRRTHPLKAWRQTQRMLDHKSREPRTWTVADAVRRFSDFVGRAVPYQTWTAWEKYRDEAGHRLPEYDSMRELFLFTGGQLRPDHYYPIEDWRAELAEQREADQAEAA